MIEDGIRTLLLNSAGIVTLVGDRGVYPQWADDDTDPPFIVYRRIATESTESLDGASGQAGCTIQLDCWTTTYRGARNLSLLVQTVLQGYSGVVGGDTIQGISFVDMRDITVPPTTKPEEGLYGSQIEFLVWCEE